MNNVELIGRIATGIKIHEGSSKMVTTLLAVKRAYSSKDGTEADFVPLTAFGKQADVLAKYVGKGQQVGISGTLKTSTYTDATGKHYGWEVMVDRLYLLDNGKRHQQPSDHQQTEQSISISLPTDMANFPTQMSDM